VVMRKHDWAARHPSLKIDLGQKAAAYAAAGIPEYWVADANGRVIHQLCAPVGEAYAERREVAFGEMVEAVTIKGLRVETGGL
jgi:Uma2 family endonuclease